MCWSRNEQPRKALKSWCGGVPVIAGRPYHFVISNSTYHFDRVYLTFPNRSSILASMKKVDRNTRAQFPPPSYGGQQHSRDCSPFCGCKQDHNFEIGRGRRVLRPLGIKTASFGTCRANEYRQMSNGDLSTVSNAIARPSKISDRELATRGFGRASAPTRSLLFPSILASAPLTVVIGF